ncbi:hypothetical protein V5799_003629 [Amblyomma americanum]|uniref:Uncharacterized protein n=1 Tax=Amblyomma americanum TaxID=6943 RepID=A0AAQ4D8F0_AMBAM
MSAHAACVIASAAVDRAYPGAKGKQRRRCNGCTLACHRLARDISACRDLFRFLAPVIVEDISGHCERGGACCPLLLPRHGRRRVGQVLQRSGEYLSKGL